MTEHTQDKPRLYGKVAVVTGIGAGIGKGCALMFARHGATVIGCDIDAAAAQATAAEAQENGSSIEVVAPCDLTREKDVYALMDGVGERHGAIHILLNAAAMAVFKPIEEMTLDDWQFTLRGELDLVFLACKAAWPHMKKEGASIINLASANAYLTLEGSPALAHCAGKGGVLAMTRQLAAEGAPHGIRANSISPGMIVTAATSPVLDQPGFIDNVLAHNMVKRLGQPEDIGWAATFLASDESTFVTAADLSVDGGATAL
ncbi:SDR family NAD(P)-dependent oxidoreductase [Emcibacter nanhaiensis]|uniref:SDR family oxidoreductase n=1 Tax=Emcibacter nanhaiensis TaxID=1505037 RepID=A0A501PFX5_9PROT|nr:SDR family oxidoreductase [Emcibacter nanhaiensis]TPD59038.1 SDR family oxidoreductase [Emcibacter nanhaiensis]